MLVIDPGHTYGLKNYDVPRDEHATLRFMKREGKKFPGNVGHYPGTNLQEVMRASIDRFRYLDKQDHHWVNSVVVSLLRTVIWLLETRAAERHGRDFLRTVDEIEAEPTCSICGHIGHVCS